MISLCVLDWIASRRWIIHFPSCKYLCAHNAVQMQRIEIFTVLGEQLVRCHAIKAHVFSSRFAQLQVSRLAIHRVFAPQKPPIRKVKKKHTLA